MSKPPRNIVRPKDSLYITYLHIIMIIKPKTKWYSFILLIKKSYFCLNGGFWVVLIGTSVR